MSNNYIKNYNQLDYEYISEYDNLLYQETRHKKTAKGHTKRLKVLQKQKDFD